MNSMTITMNGKKTTTAESATLVTLLRENGISDSVEGIAVAVNSTVVPRSRWSEQRLSDGDMVEVINAVQGG